MLDFFLWTVGILSIISMLINYIYDWYYIHHVFMRINQVLMYIVALISIACMYLSRFEGPVFRIAILGFVISMIKSLLYYRVYTQIVKNQETDSEEKNDNENEED